MAVRGESKTNIYRKNKKFVMMALNNMIALIKQKNVRVLHGEIETYRDFDEIPGRFGIIARKANEFQSFKLTINICKPVKKSTK